MTTERDDRDAWRTHEVPTFTQAEDTWLFGLTAKQLLGVVIAVVLGYVVFQFAPLWFLPLVVRIGIGAVVGALAAGFVAIRPGGRTMFGIIREYLSFRFGARYHVNEVRDLIRRRPMEQPRRRRRRRRTHLRLSVPLPGRTVTFQIRLPFGRGGGNAATGMLLLVAAASMAGCGMDRAQAQVADDYRGRRVYLQSVVVKLSGPVNEGAQAATIRLRAAAPLKEAGPRVNETLQSVTELESHGTRVLPAWTKVGSEGPVAPSHALGVGDEFVFENIYLGDLRDIRPYCDIAMREGHYVRRQSPARISYRAHSEHCRIRAQGGAVDDVEGLSVRDAISKPVLSVNWQDRKRNQGALSIGEGMLPYPKLRVISVTPSEEIHDGDAILLDRHEICNGNDVEIVSLGIQSERPANPVVDDYFDGETGQRIAGEVRTCPLVAPHNVRVILEEMAIFAQGNADFEIRVRPVVSTLMPQNIVNSANLVVLDRNGVEGPEFQAPMPGDADFDPLKPDTVKFNLAPPVLEDKRNSTDPDSAIIQLRLDLTHQVTVKRPIHQPVEHYDRRVESHISSCSCSCSRSGSCPGGCSCSKNSSRSYADYEYWPEHDRVEKDARQYLPDSEEANVVLVFEQQFLFEKMLVTFDRPFEELMYVDPTPEPGEAREPDYFEEGRVIGLWDGEPLHCDSSIVQDDEGRWTGWLWVTPGINSKGEAYGGCRRAFACKLNIPEQEEPFGPGGTPTEDDYECVNR